MKPVSSNDRLMRHANLPYADRSSAFPTFAERSGFQGRRCIGMWLSSDFIAEDQPVISPASRGPDSFVFIARAGQRDFLRTRPQNVADFAKQLFFLRAARTNDIIMPPIGKIMGGVNFSDLANSLNSLIRLIDCWAEYVERVAAYFLRRLPALPTAFSAALSTIAFWICSFRLSTSFD